MSPSDIFKLLWDDSSLRYEWSLVHLFIIFTFLSLFFPNSIRIRYVSFLNIAFEIAYVVVGTCPSYTEDDKDQNFRYLRGTENGDLKAHGDVGWRS